jgi:hypothetical protein
MEGVGPRDKPEEDGSLSPLAGITPSVWKPEKDKRQEESSFCEQATAKGPRRKEAKKSHPLAPGSLAHRVSYEKSFFASFFPKKEDSSFLH